MKYLKICFHLLISICFIIASCKKNVITPIGNSNTSFGQIFGDFWNKMNVNYVYWDIDTTNWDNVYKTYKPVFEKLNINNTNDVYRSEDYFRKITSGLIDSHYIINFSFPTLTGSYLYPSLDRKLRDQHFHSPYIYSIVDTNYFDSGYISGKYVTTDTLKLTTVCGIINKKILYFNCNRFALQEAYGASGNNTVKLSLQYFFNQLQNSPSTIKGIIIDVRNNPGGNVTDLNFLVGHLIEQQVQFGFTRYKSGNGRLDFTPWINSYLIPQTSGKNLNVPIIALADNYTISLAEAVVMAIHTLPKGVVIGERTWGATGPTTSNQLYNDGPFSVSAFLSVSEASSEFKYIDGKQYEGVGFSPDIPITINASQLTAKHDPILEKAISLIH